MSEDPKITIQEVPAPIGARIKVIGVGGGGGNMVNHLIAQGVHPDLELAVANTDAQALNVSEAPYRIQLGVQLTKGLGAGMKPDVGQGAAIESLEDIKAFVKDADIVFVCAGLGGGTGTGAAPVIAQAAKDMGALTISVITKPFVFEQLKRSRIAEQGLLELKKASDTLVVIPNQKLLSIIPKNLGIRDSFKIVDDVLAQAVNGISGVILTHGKINLDFADVRTIMEHRGLALMGIGEAFGDDAATNAVKNAVESPLFDNMSINGAMGILVAFHNHPDYPTNEIAIALELVREYASEEAEVIFGMIEDERMQLDHIRVTVVATGFERELVHGEDEEGNTLKLVAPKDFSQSSKTAPAGNVLGLRKVSGGDYDQNEDLLDVPSYIRHQKD